MSNIILLYISIISPILLLLFVLKNELRNVFLFYILGSTICIISGEINGFILTLSGVSKYLMTINITPVVEEILKALPLIYFAFVFKPEDASIFKAGISLGIGFAVLETSSAFISSMETATVWWALLRGLGAGLLHSLCGLGMAFGLVSAKKLKKAFLPVIIATFAITVLFHSSYNILVQSEVSWSALVLTGFVYAIIAFIIFQFKKAKVSNNA